MSFHHIVPEARLESGLLIQLTAEACSEDSGGAARAPTARATYVHGRDAKKGERHQQSNQRGHARVCSLEVDSSCWQYMIYVFAAHSAKH